MEDDTNVLLLEELQNLTQLVPAWPELGTAQPQLSFLTNILLFGLVSTAICFAFYLQFSVVPCAYTWDFVVLLPYPSWLSLSFNKYVWPATTLQYSLPHPSWRSLFNSSCKDSRLSGGFLYMPVGGPPVHLFKKESGRADQWLWPVLWLAIRFLENCWRQTLDTLGGMQQSWLVYIG